MSHSIPTADYQKAETMAVRMAATWWRHNRNVLPVGFDQEDAEQSARIGVLKAHGRFDPSRGASFSTFAAHYALGDVRRAARDFARLPRAAYEAKRWDLLPISLDAPVHGDGEGKHTALRELLPGGTDPTVNLLSSSLWSYLEKLPPRLAQIIQWRYREEWSQRQVGDRIGLSQMHVSRLERQALGMLKELMMHETSEPVKTHGLNTAAQIAQWIDESGLSLAESIPMELQRKWAKALGVGTGSTSSHISQLRVKRGIPFTGVVSEPAPPAPAAQQERLSLKEFIRTQLQARLDNWHIPFTDPVEETHIEAWAKQYRVYTRVVHALIAKILTEAGLSAPEDSAPDHSGNANRAAPVEKQPEDAPFDFVVKDWETLYQEEQARNTELQTLLERHQSAAVETNAKVHARITELEERLHEAEAELSMPSGSPVPTPAPSFAIPNRYYLLAQLLGQLPANAFWTRAQRNRWLDAVVAVVDLLTEEEKAAEKI